MSSSAVAMAVSPDERSCASTACFSSAWEQFEALVTWAEGSAGTLSEVEQGVEQRGREVLRAVVQGHLDLRSRREERMPAVEGADEIRRTHRRERSTASIVGALMGSAVRVATPKRKRPKPQDKRVWASIVDDCEDVINMMFDEALRRDLAAGFPIATGVIEGTVRHLVNDRMAITGAHWRLRSAEAVLRLRALRCSGDFDAYWAFHERCELQRNHLNKYPGATLPPTSSTPQNQARRPILRLCS